MLFARVLFGAVSIHIWRCAGSRFYSCLLLYLTSNMKLPILTVVAVHAFKGALFFFSFYDSKVCSHQKAPMLSNLISLTNYFPLPLFGHTFIIIFIQHLMIAQAQLFVEAAK